MMGNTAVWTAAHYRIPILFLVANNRSFYNDEVHQERVAVARNRPVDNKWIGQRIADPDIDIGMVARGQGAKGFGPCRNAGELEKALKEAIAVVEGGGVAVVDARILGGYSPKRNTLMVDWSSSEFSRVRLQLARDYSRMGLADTQIFLQYIVSMGAHGAHKF